VLLVTFGVFITNMSFTSYPNHPADRRRQRWNRGNLSDRLIDDQDGFSDEEDNDDETTSVIFYVMLFRRYYIRWT